MVVVMGDGGGDGELCIVLLAVAYVGCLSGFN